MMSAPILRQAERVSRVLVLLKLLLRRKYLRFQLYFDARNLQSLVTSESHVVVAAKISISDLDAATGSGIRPCYGWMQS